MRKTSRFKQNHQFRNIRFRPHRTILSIAILVIAISSLSLLPHTSANPMGADPDSDMSPMPHSETSVYLKSEKVIVHVDDIAHVNATYTFHNDGNKSTTLTIYLPFKSRPRNLLLLVDNVTAEYKTIVFDQKKDYPDRNTKQNRENILSHNPY